MPWFSITLLIVNMIDDSFGNDIELYTGMIGILDDCLGVCVDSTSEGFREIESQVQLLIETGEPLRDSQPRKALELFEKAWKLAIDNELSEAMHILIPHLGRLYFTQGQDKQKMLDMNLHALKLAEDEQDDDLLAKSALALSWVYSQTQRYTENIEVIQKGLNAVHRIGDRSLEGSLLNNLAVCYSTTGNLDQSLSIYFQLMKLGEEIGDPSIIQHAYLNVQKVYMALHDLKKTEEYGLKALEMAEESGDSGAVAGVKINLCVVYRHYDRMHEALEMINESIAILETIPERITGLTSALLNRGIILMSLNRHSESEVDLSRTIDLAKKIDHKEWLLRGYDELGKLKLEMGHEDQAEELFNRSLEIACEIGQPEFYIVANSSLYELYKRRKDFKAACEVHEKILKYETMNFSERLASSLADMEVRYEMEKKVQEAEFYRCRSEDLEKMNYELQSAYDKLKLSQDAVRDLERKSSIMAMAVTANHELNQPLMIIHGNLELLRGRLNPNDAVKARYYQRIETALHRIESILQKYRSQGEMHLTEYTDTTMMFEFEDFDQQDV